MAGQEQTGNRKVKEEEEETPPPRSPAGWGVGGVCKGRMSIVGRLLAMGSRDTSDRHIRTFELQTFSVCRYGSS